MADWNERYSRGEHATLEPSHLLVRFIDTFQPGRALDLACGAGRHAIFLAERGWDVTAVDASHVGIDLTKKRAHERNLSLTARVADLERGQFKIEPEAYDLICDFYYLQRDLFPQIRAGVRPGGTVIAAIHLADEDDTKKGMNPAFLLQPDELRAEFRGWKIVHYHETSLHDPDAGEHHRRTADIVAEKG